MMEYHLRRATPDDQDALLRLYFSHYGPSYPLKIGSDPGATRAALQSAEVDWWIFDRTAEHGGEIVGSVIFEIDQVNRIGKVSGLLVSPSARGKGLGTQLIDRGLMFLLGEGPGPDGFLCGQPLNSVYATARTRTAAPQKLLLQAGLIPLGILPNAHKISDYETLVLLARFRKGVLQNRIPYPPVPEKIGSILDLIDRELGPRYSHLPPTKGYSETIPLPPPVSPSVSNDLDFEFILAPEFVKKRFLSTFADPYDRFYPFHPPNLLMVEKNGETEEYAYLNQRDGYCALVARTQPVWKFRGRLRSWLNQLRDYGASYVETLVRTQNTPAFETLLDAQFLPSAIYPAMFQTDDGRMQDVVLMSRAMEPLNFRGLEVHEAFKPFVDHYLVLWKRAFLESLAVVE